MAKKRYDINFHINYLRYIFTDIYLIGLHLLQVYLCKYMYHIIFINQCI